MEELDVWLKKTIKQEDNKGIMSAWLEERRFELVSLLRQVLIHILNGGSLIMLTDSQRQWFGKYVMQNINLPNKTRPFFPIMEIESLNFMIDTAYGNASDKHFSAINKMLEHSFGKNYAFWYVGKKTIRGEFVLLQEKSFVWLIDEHSLPSAFGLSSIDDLLDYKLLQLYRLFEKALCAVVFGQISLET